MRRSPQPGNATLQALVGLLLAAVTAGAQPAATPVSPGDAREALAIEGRCPTLSWSPAPGSSGTELALYELEPGDAAAAPRLALHRRFPGGASSFTPGRAECLEPGREYAWLVRALTRDESTGDPAAASPDAASWSSPFRFRVAALPSEAELAAALATLDRWREPTRDPGGSSAAALPDGSDLRRSATPAAAARTPPEAAESPTVAGVAAIRGELPDVEGSAFGVFGVSHSPAGAGLVARNEAGGPDLVLDGFADGEADTLFGQSGIDRPSVGAVSFSLGNTTGGGFSLAVAGAIEADEFLGDASITRDDEVLDLVRAGDGPGSGLDADLLDGLEAGQFAAATALAAHVANSANPHQVTATQTSPATTNGDLEVFDGAAIVRLPAGLDGQILRVNAAAPAGLSWSEDALGIPPGQSCPPGAYLSGFDPAGAVLCSPLALPPRVSTLGWANALDLALTIGADGHPLFVVGMNDGNALSWTRCDNLGCSNGERTGGLVDDPPPESFYFRTSLAIGSDGFPVVSYEDYPTRALKVARCAPACTASTVDDPLGEVGDFTSIAIAGDGLPVVAYRDVTNRAVRVAKCNDLACSGGDEAIQILDDSPSGDVGLFLAMAIGVDGFPVLSYLDANAEALRVAKCNDYACAGGDETISTVDDPVSSVGWYTSIAIGADGFPVISYVEEMSGALWIAKCDDPACAPGGETISFLDGMSGDGWRGTSIVVGPDGLPIVAYNGQSPSGLRLAKCNDPACSGGDETISMLDAAATALRSPSLAIGSDGFPIVAYHDAIAGSVKIAHCLNPSCEY
jgi:hypothetical protein